MDIKKFLKPPSAVDELSLDDIDFDAIAEKQAQAQAKDTAEAATLGNDGDCDGCKI